MSLFVIGDLHLSFSVDKPMDIFGNNWENHAEKIKKNWIEKVKPEDTVILPGDFSWATYLDESKADFEYLNLLPGRKILSKGNHDYWWNTVSKMKNFLFENNFENIEFLYNNSFCVENKVIVGARGWLNLYKEDDNYKILKRENDRLKLSIAYANKEFDNSLEKIAFIHYPPFYKESVPEEIDFIKTLKDNNIKRCFYGHLHGPSHKDAFEGMLDGIEFKLISSDYLDFNLVEIK